MSVFPEAIKADFDRDGFTAIRGFLDRDEIASVESALDRYIGDVVPGIPAEHVFYEDKSDPATLKQLPHMHSHDPFFHHMLNEGGFRELAEVLLASAVVPTNIQYLCKPPRVGKATPPHQDGYYFMIDPVEGLTMWLGLDVTDEENGCLRYVRGSHRKGLRPHGRTETLGFSLGITDFGTEDDLAAEAAITAEPGDLLVHHALTIHRADGNLTERPRRAIGLVYISEEAAERTDDLAEYRRQLARDLSDEGKI